jgi:hypothetical protein
MVVRIAGQRMYLWRAVDHEGEVLDMLVQRRRDCRAALRLMRKLLKKQGFPPKLLVTDKLRSYSAAFRRLRLYQHFGRSRGGARPHTQASIDDVFGYPIPIDSVIRHAALSSVIDRRGSTAPILRRQEAFPGAATSICQVEPPVGLGADELPTRSECDQSSFERQQLQQSGRHRRI